MRRAVFPMVVAATTLLLAGTAGAQVPAGDEFVVNVYTPDYQQRTRIAMQPGGAFVVVWQSYGQDGAAYAAMAQRFDASGQRLGGEFIVNTTTLASQARPAVASDRRGNFVVVWQSLSQDGSNYGIIGQRFDVQGRKRGGEFQVNTFTTSTEYRPSVAMSPGGAFLVAWTCSAGAARDGSDRAVSARVFDANGVPLGADFVVNTYTTGAQYQPSVAALGSGRFVVAWDDAAAPDNSGRGVQGQLFATGGARVGGEFRVNTSTLGDQYLFHSGVSAAPDGTFVVAYTDPNIDGDGVGVAAQRFDASGTPLGGELLVNTFNEATQRLAATATDAQGNFVVSWESDSQDAGGFGVFGQRFAADGTPRGGEFEVSTFGTGNQFRSSVGSDPAGNFVVTWTTYALQDGSNTAAMARRFGGLVPKVLRVDTSANGVLEPGETVDVRPAWLNVTGADQAVTGTLSALTGPAGPTYTITDSAGDYGTLPDGASFFCSNCYGVAVSNPAARPALHWDASVLESLAPAEQGQQQRWLLHVGASFDDQPLSSTFYPFVETLLHNGVTGGCTPTGYCGSTPSTRAQMAVFVLLGKEGAGYTPVACTTPVFGDVPAASPFCRYVEELARRGVVSGCGNGRYCPDDATTREQMAVFVLRTLDPDLVPPACTTPVFTDVPASSPFCRWIEELVRRAVVAGCGGGRYCPQDPVSREQMAVFISATFGLTLYGP